VSTRAMHLEQFLSKPKLNQRHLGLERTSRREVPEASQKTSVDADPRL